MAEQTSSDGGTPPQVNLIIGASSAIGAAIIQRLKATDDAPILTVARTDINSDDPLAPPQYGARNDGRSGPQHWVCDYSEASIAAVAADIAQQQVDLKRVIICNGVLHGEDFGPERTLRRLDPAAMKTVFETNAMLPMQWLSALFDVLKQSSAPIVVVLSARVGSIGDNRMGGWYSYRGSKAALNMMLQCAAIELHRVNKGSRVLAFHPGTTDSPLSKPFQKNVPPEKLFTPSYVAERLLVVSEEVAAETATAGKLAYRDWAGVTIPW